MRARAPSITTPTEEPASAGAPPPADSGALAGWRGGLALAGAVALAGVLAALFLPHQSLWVDETTQLAGVRLGPGRLLGWLAGRGPDLGVPPDRAPPLSYLVQMAWAAVAGDSEWSLRWLSLLLGCAGVAFTALAARRAHGPAAALVATLFLALSPNVAVYAVEVRAYPLFFALSGAAAYLAVRVQGAAPGDRPRWLAALTFVLVLAIQTHFFGLVLAGATWIGLLVDAVRGRRHLRPLLLCGAVLGLAAVGLLPFVAAAGRLSAGAEPASAGLRGVVRLGYRLYGHPALSASPAAVALASAGLLVATVAALLARRALSTLAILAAGLAAVGVATGVVRGFDATAPHYNVWALPFVALFIGSGLQASGARVRALAAAGAAALLLGTAVGALELHRRPDVYAHGPQRALIDLVRRLGPERVVVVHDAGSEASGHVFFPLRFTFGRSFPQYACATPCDRLVPFDPRDPIAPDPGRDLAVVVRTSHTPASALTRGGTVAAASASPAEGLLTARGFNVESRSHWTANVSADVEVLRRSR